MNEHDPTNFSPTSESGELKPDEPQTDKANQTAVSVESTQSAHLQTDAEYVAAIDLLLSHVWMVRTFLKHSEEAEEDDELQEVHRTLYDYMLALGAPLRDEDHAKYLKLAKKKLKKLQSANELFLEIQPEISSHTNFQMAATSLNEAVKQIAELIAAQAAAKRVA